MLIFDNVVKRFDSNTVLNQFSYTFDNNKTCIIGHNGCGKTTLLMLAAGLETPTEGNIRLNDTEVTTMENKRIIGISCDKIVYPRFLSAKQLIEFHCQNHRITWPRSLIERFNFESQLTTKAPDLSLGNQKKLSLILAMSHQPQYLLLDEPSTGLDKQSNTVIQQLISDYTGRVIITSHNKQFTEDPTFDVLDLTALPAK